MKILISREVFGNKFTLGTLSVDGKHLGYTCEDTDRRLEDGGDKVYGQTAIPRGKYRVTLSFSHRFQKVMPEVLGVEGFSGVRIHGGNTHENTLGCPLLGAVRTKEGVANCAGVNTRLIQLIEQTEESGEQVWLEIV